MDESQVAVQRLKRGDIGGLETLFTRYQVSAVRTAFLILQDEAAAQDVVLETFLRIYQLIGYFDETQPFELYLLKSVVYAALNAARALPEQYSCIFSLVGIMSMGAISSLS